MKRSHTFALSAALAGLFIGGTASAQPLSYDRYHDVEIRDHRTRRPAPRAPVIISVTPERGQPGSLIRIRGRNFTGADRAYLGDVELTVVRRSQTLLEARIPRTARTGQYVWVVGPRGEDRSDRIFALTRPQRPHEPGYGWYDDRPWQGDRPVQDNWPYDDRGHAGEPPMIERLGARAAKPGREVSLRIRSFHRNDRIFLDDRQVEVRRIMPNGDVVVRVPTNMQPGSYWFTVRRGRSFHRAEKSFAIEQPAVIQGTPEQVGAGSTFVINGRYFDDQVKVYFGSTQLRVLSVEPRKLVVELPRGARGVEYLTVVDGAIRNRSARPVEIVGGPRAHDRYERDRDGGRDYRDGYYW